MSLAAATAQVALRPIHFSLIVRKQKLGHSQELGPASSHRHITLYYKVKIANRSNSCFARRCSEDMAY